MKVMSKSRRTFSVDKKLEILHYAEDHGTVETCRKYQISQNLFYRWRQEFNRSGIDGLAPAYQTVDPEVKALEKENERLKRIIARQALEIVSQERAFKKNEQYHNRLKKS